MKLPNGFGSIVNLGKRRRRPYGARITVGWTDEGKCIYKYIGYYHTKGEALAALSEFHAKPYDLEGNQLTFAEVYHMWAKRDLKNASKSKISCYTYAFANCTDIHDMKLKSIRTCHLQQAVDNCKNRSLSSLNNIRILFKQVYRYALENDFISKDYSAFVTISDTAPKAEKKAFTEEEIAVLWEHTDNYYVRFALILIYTGLRITELLELKTENVNLAENYMQGGIKTKAGKNRIIPIHHRIKPFIAGLYNPNNVYLYDDNGNPCKANIYRKSFVNTLSEFNIRHLPHECRHTTATLMDRYGADPICIKRILGHSTNDLTSSVYIHKDVSGLIEAIEVIP